MNTVLDLVNEATSDIGVRAAGEVLPFADADEGRVRLNRLLDQYAIQRQQIFKVTRTVFPVVANQAEYLIGAEFDQPITEDFDSPWAGAPAGWTAFTAGSATINNDTTVFQSGEHSIRFEDTVTGGAYIYRDFVVQPGSDLTISVYTYASFTVSGYLRVRNLTTGNYLTNASAWTGVSSDCISSPAGAAFVLKTISFTAEDSDAPTVLLRVQLGINVVNASAWFDTFSLSGIAAVPIPRPVYIDRVNLVNNTPSPAVETPLTPLTDEAWARLPQKDATSTVPSSWYYNPTFSAGTLTLWPMPTDASYDVAIYVPTQVNQFDSLTDTVLLPPGYERMLIKNLALELCPSYQANPHPLLVQQAKDAMNAVKAANVRMADLSFDARTLGQTGGRRYDIRTG